MNRGINRSTILGFLGSDPSTRYGVSGNAVTTIRVATSESWKDKTTGQQQERTEWHRIKFFGRLAEVASEYLKKGSQVFIEGKHRTEEYEKDGAKHYDSFILAEELQMIGSRRDTNGGGGEAGKSAHNNTSGAEAMSAERSLEDSPQQGYTDDFSDMDSA